MGRPTGTSSINVTIPRSVYIEAQRIATRRGSDARAFCADAIAKEVKRIVGSRRYHRQKQRQVA